jgi:hypothetical protein
MGSLSAPPPPRPAPAHLVRRCPRCAHVRRTLAAPQEDLAESQKGNTGQLPLGLGRLQTLWQAGRPQG